MSIIADAIKMTTLPQKVMFGGLAAALLAAGSYNVVQAIDNRHLSAENSKLDTRINDPKTGYVIKLSRAETNTETCKAAVDKQTAAIKAQSARDAATVAAVQPRYDAAHKDRVAAETSAAVMLSRKPTGENLTDRVLDVDAQILGDLK